MIPIVKYEDLIEMGQLFTNLNTDIFLILNPKGEIEKGTNLFNIPAYSAYIPQEIRYHIYVCINADINEILTKYSAELKEKGSSFKMYLQDGYEWFLYFDKEDMQLYDGEKNLILTK